MGSSLEYWRLRKSDDEASVALVGALPDVVYSDAIIGTNLKVSKSIQVIHFHLDGKLDPRIIEEWRQMREGVGEDRSCNTSLDGENADCGNGSRQSHRGVDEMRR
jgi:hypothetical protein